MTAIPATAKFRPQVSLSRLSRLIFKPFKLSSSEANFTARGFTAFDPAKRRHLEAIGHTFIGGYNAALDAQHASDIRIFVDTIGPELRGFAAEGASMGAAVRSSILFCSTFLASVIGLLESDFDYLTHVGVGWATARVPWQTRRHRLLLDPIHHWLAVDGLGFHDTYFFPDKVCAGWRRGLSGYAPRPYDHGVGRALWFVASGNVAQAIALLAALSPDRHADLWAGLGLAMTYAGPTDGDEMAAALCAAGRHQAAFAQGAAFACAARARAGYIPGHTEAAIWPVWKIGAAALCSLVRDARARLPDRDGDVPRYETWRRSIATSFSLIVERRS